MLSLPHCVQHSDCDPGDDADAGERQHEDGQPAKRESGGEDAADVDASDDARRGAALIYFGAKDAAKRIGPDRDADGRCCNQR
jgi:hypothetical protein